MILSEGFDFLLKTHYIRVAELCHNLDFAFNCHLSMLVEHSSSFICFYSILIVRDLVSDKSNIGISSLSNMSHDLIVVKLSPIFAIGCVC